MVPLWDNNKGNETASTIISGKQITKRIIKYNCVLRK